LGGILFKPCGDLPSSHVELSVNGYLASLMDYWNNMLIIDEPKQVDSTSIEQATQLLFAQTHQHQPMRADTCSFLAAYGADMLPSPCPGPGFLIGNALNSVRRQ